MNDRDSKPNSAMQAATCTTQAKLKPELDEALGVRNRAENGGESSKFASKILKHVSLNLQSQTLSLAIAWLASLHD